MNRAEAQIAVRDLVMFNLLEAVIGEGTGKLYREAVQEADRQVEAAMKRPVGD